MLSIDLKKTTSDFLESSDTFSALLDVIAKISSYYDDTIPHVLALASGGDKLNSAAASIHSRYANLQSVTRAIVPQSVYQAAIYFRQAVQADLDVAVRESELAIILSQNVDDFIARYDGFLMDPNLQTAAALMLQAHKTEQLLNSAFSAFHLISTALEASVDADVDESAVSLILSQVQDFDDFTRKLDAFRALYRELCFVLGTTEGSHPLRVSKIESGSLWIKVFGDTRVIQLLVAIIESTVGYLHRRFTTEGRIAAVPRKLESLDAAIQITAKLQALGVDTSDMEENLRKSGVAISRGLAELLDDQPRVQINRKVYSVGLQIEPLLLAQRSTLRLRDQSERVEPTLEDQDPPPPGSAA